MPPYNPVNDFYLRQSQPYQYPSRPIPQVNCRFVTNREEARVAMIDGFSYNVFLDTSNGKIYLKKLNNNGLSEFLTYSIDEEKTVDPMTEINTRLSRIENIIGGKYESIPGNASSQQSQSVYHSAITEKNERNDETEPPSLSKSYGDDEW